MVETLWSLGQTVGVTEDGVDNVPVLKTANFGFSMAGTGVANAASSIILIDG